MSSNNFWHLYYFTAPTHIKNNRNWWCNKMFELILQCMVKISARGERLDVSHATLSCSARSHYYSECRRRLYFIDKGDDVLHVWELLRLLLLFSLVFLLPKKTLPNFFTIAVRKQDFLVSWHNLHNYFQFSWERVCCVLSLNKGEMNSLIRIGGRQIRDCNWLKRRQETI